MNKKPQNRYQQVNRLQDDLSQQIQNLKSISTSINKQLKTQQKSRQGLQQYLDAGIEGLKKTNKILNQLVGSRTLFGCNICILFGITLLVIIILIFI